MAATDDGKTGLNEYRAGQMLNKAEWAANAFSAFERPAVLRIAEAAAEAGAARARHFADATIAETGFGNADHKFIKNEMCSRGIFQHYREDDYVGFRVDPARKIVEVPKPAGVIFALTPSTNPVATVFFKIVLALLTRNAIVISPHPAARKCCVEAALVMAGAAREAGAPDGVIQVIEEPTIPLIDCMMKSDKTDVILATGGTPMVRAAYSSGNPALGVGPGNCPAYVDSSAEIAKAAKDIADSKSFDNSVLCTNESAVIAHTDIAGPLRTQLRKQGAYICNDEERQLVEDGLFPFAKFNIAMLGRSAPEIARECGVRVPPKTRILVVPLARVGDDYPLSNEKMCPVLGFYEVPDAAAGLIACQTMVRRSGGGHSAAVHAADPQIILRFGARLGVLRIAVNAPCSTGAAGFQTHLAPTMTIGTGFLGRSAISENLRPDHLVQWTKIAFDKDDSVAFPSFEGLSLAETRSRPATREPAPAPSDAVRDMREEIRRIIVEELRQYSDGVS